MHICHVNLARGFRGGERQTELLVTELARAGLRQHFVCREDSPMREHLADVPGLRFHLVNHFLLGHTTALPGVSLVHAHDAKAAHWAYWEFRLRRTPYMITRRVPNPLKENRLTRAVYRNSRKVVALSHAIETSIRDYLADARTVIIPSMLAHLPSDAVAVSEIRQRFMGKVVVGHIGALVQRHKGQSFLIEAARMLQGSLPQAHFLLLGEGEDEARFRRQAEGLTNITFEGFRANVGDYLAAFDLFAFPSLQEGLGSILLDAMDFCLPIVAGNAGGIPDIIKDGYNGLLVPPGDANALAGALEKMITDADLARQLALNGKEFGGKFSPAHIAQQYRCLYEQLLGGDSTLTRRLS